MAGWSGFTDNELQRLKQDNDTQSINIKIKESKVGQQQRKKVKEKKINMRKEQAQECDKNVKAPTELPANNVDTVKKVAEKSPMVESKVPKEKEEVIEASKSVGDEKEIGVLSSDQVVELEKDRLEMLQEQQKHIKAQNEKKEEMIKQALQQKYKQTQIEALKLKEIQKELNHLDEVLQSDVEVLRNRIDEVCVLFSHAQKRHEKAEAEYVEAKLQFFQQKEQKEQLTEHLYKIIQDNEVRKAKKLEELMLKLSYGEPSSPVSTHGEVPVESSENNNIQKPAATSGE